MEPRVLPPVTVSAKVPLVKVADYHLREARAAAAAVTVGDFIYVIGGTSGIDPALKSIERFDPRSGRSEHFANLRTGRAFHGAIGWHGKIYVIGGKVEGFAAEPVRTSLSTEVPPQTGLIPDASVEIVDVATAVVSRGPAMPEARAGFGCVIAADKIYVIGGEKESDYSRILTNTVEVFDLVTGQWSAGVPMPPGPRNVAVVGIEDLIVRPGGYNGLSETRDVAVFNPRKQVWTELPPLVQAMYASSAVYSRHYLFLFGDYEAPDTVLAYDLITKASEVIDVPFKPARLTTAAIHGENMYVMGGLSSSQTTALDYVQVYTVPKPPAR